MRSTISYTYNQVSQLTAASDPDSSYACTYDNLGRLLSVDNDGTGGVPRVILSSAYDAEGNRTSLSATIDSTDDFSNSYHFDALNRVRRILQQGVTGGNTVAEKRIDRTYNVDGRYDSIKRFNDIAGFTSAEIATSTYSYDSLGRLTGLDDEQGGTDLFSTYAYERTPGICGQSKSGAGWRRGTIELRDRRVVSCGGQAAAGRITACKNSPRLRQPFGRKMA